MDIEISITDAGWGPIVLFYIPSMHIMMSGPSRATLEEWAKAVCSSLGVEPRFLEV